MKYIEFKNHFKKFIVFSTNDIFKWDSAFDTRRLVEWQQKGYLLKIINRWYIFNDQPIAEHSKYIAANRINAPSYISLELALSHYGLIPEGVFQYTSVTTARPCVFDTPIGNFSYRHFKPALYFGFNLMQEQDMNYKLATPEKALLDFLYFNPNISSVDDVEGLRLNPLAFGETINNEILNKYLDAFDNKSLKNRTNKVMKYLRQYA